MVYVHTCDQAVPVVGHSDMWLSSLMDMDALTHFRSTGRYTL